MKPLFVIKCMSEIATFDYIYKGSTNLINNVDAWQLVYVSVRFDFTFEYPEI